MMAGPVIAAAKGWIGTPYQHQGSLKQIGCDCLGLVRGVWREVMGQEPEEAPAYTPDWAEAAGVESLAMAAARHFEAVVLPEIAPGDVILFRWRHDLPAKHCGILTGPDRMIHAHEGACVAEVAFAGWWRRHLAFAFRFPPVVR